jgi:ElaA protein
LDWKLKKFNELTIEELYGILKLRNEIFVVEQQCTYQDCDDKDKSAVHLFLRDKDEFITYLRIMEKGVSYNEISIGRVCVNKKYRGKGLSRAMMLEALKYIEENLNEYEVRISAQTYLIEFYKSLGFREVSEEYLEDNIPHVEMLFKRNPK